MAERDQESKDVMGAAMRYVKTSDRSQLETFSLSVLRKADYQLEDRDNGSGYRRAIADRITELESIQRTLTKEPRIMDIKPTFYGVSININELWRRARNWFRKRR